MICSLEHSRVAGIKFLPLFSRGLLPVEIVLGESPVLTRRMERLTVFPEWKSSQWPFVKVS